MSGGASVKALVLNEYHHLSVETRPDPPVGSGEVRLRVAATGICGSDLHGYTGENGRRHRGQVMGHETVATVESIGEPDADGDTAAAGLAIGQLVTVNPVMGCGQCRHCREHAEQRCAERRVIGVDPAISAAFAELMTVPARNVVPLPNGFPVPPGALIEPLAVGFHAARRGDVSDGSHVLVIGGGPIGQAAALAARRLGAAVAVAEISPSRRQLLDHLGFHVLDPAGGRLAEEACDRLGQPPDVVIDAVGRDETLGAALSASAVAARIVIVGMDSPRLELGAYQLTTAERTLLGSFSYGSQEFADTAAWAGGHLIDLEPLISDIVPLDAAPKAFADLARGAGPAGKVLVRLDGAP